MQAISPESRAEALSPSPSQRFLREVPGVLAFEHRPVGWLEDLRKARERETLELIKKRKAPKAKRKAKPKKSKLEQLLAAMTPAQRKAAGFE
jgi:hypothetical protein